MRHTWLFIFALSIGPFQLTAQVPATVPAQVPAQVSAQVTDPYAWLEEINGTRAMEFVKKQNARTIDMLSQREDYQRIYKRSLEIYTSQDRITFPTIYGKYCYNFWQDKEHARGIWRRASKESYMSGKPEWRTLIDVDALSKKDSIPWVFKSAHGLYPGYDRFLISLSKGGGDAVVIREFDAVKVEFDTLGFNLPESKGNVYYLDANTLLVAMDFGEGSMTTSGLPRQLKLWSRGTDISQAKKIFEGETTDVRVVGWVLRDDEHAYTMALRSIGMGRSANFVWHNNALQPLLIPEDAQVHTLIQNQFVLGLHSDWSIQGTLYKKGDLISLDFASLLDGKLDAYLVYRPSDRSSILGVSNTRTALLLELMTNVRSELHLARFVNKKWSLEKVPAPEYGTISVVDIEEGTDRYFFSFTNFLEPTTLYRADAEKNSVERFQSLPASFDASNYRVQQFEATSKDGTKIPYFVVGSKTMQLNGKNPTLLSAYGGFGVSSKPAYSSTAGCAWMEYGGVYVLANIRGGGEFGPAWHQAAKREKRQNGFDDFHAVAQDLIARKITSPEHLGIMGGSNGGLLVGVAYTQRPDLYNAVICQVPLLDMQRYTKLLAGASWIAEYGDPDKAEDWEFIRKYSPYQNLLPDKHYPEVFFSTSTRDDRVHPAHARKMAAKMLDMGYPVYYYENTEGGHAASATAEQRARAVALHFSYLIKKLKD